MDPERILIIRFSSLGDLLLLLAVPAALKARFPAASIDVVVKREFAEAVRGQPHLAAIHVFDPAEGLRGLLRLATRLRTPGYDLVYDAHGSLRSRVLCTRLGPARRVRLRKETLRRLALIAFRWKGVLPRRTMIERLLSPLEGLGIEPRGPGPSFAVAPGAAASVENLLRGRPAPHLALAPGARWTSKRWAPEKFAALGDAFLERREGSVWIVGGRGDEEAARAVRAAMGTGGGEVVAGRLDLQESASLLARCEGLVTNDSALLHLAEAVGTPVAAFFGPTVPAFGYAPRLPGSILLERALGCRPCSRNGRRGCPIGTRACLADLSAGEALSRLAAWPPLVAARGAHRPGV